MNRDLRTVLDFACDHAPPRVSEAARRLLARPKAPRKTGILTRKQEKRDAKAERNARMARIRMEVMQRHGNKCVVCGALPSWGECHHLISGTGRRRVEESAETCVWVCDDLMPGKCHKRAPSDPDALRRIAAYCVANNMPEAARAVSRRLAKVLEARESRRSSGRGT